jgi:hypothetical protein
MAEMGKEVEINLRAARETYVGAYSDAFEDRG